MGFSAPAFTFVNLSNIPFSDTPFTDCFSVVGCHRFLNQLQNQPVCCTMLKVFPLKAFPECILNSWCCCFGLTTSSQTLSLNIIAHSLFRLATATTALWVSYLRIRSTFGFAGTFISAFVQTQELIFPRCDVIYSTWFMFMCFYCRKWGFWCSQIKSFITDWRLTELALNIWW